MYPTLTKRQKEILDYIKVYTQLNGYAPSLLDIKNHFQLSAISTVHEHLQNLKVKGYIHKEINQARSIRALNPELKANETVEIPLIGSINHEGQFVTTPDVKTMLIHKDLLHRQGKYFAIKIVGDGYVSSGLLSGDNLLCLEDVDPQNNNIVVVEMEKHKLLLKKYLQDKAKLRLQSLTNQNDYTQAPPSSIKGVVIMLLRSY